MDLLAWFFFMVGWGRVKVEKRGRGRRTGREEDRKGEEEGRGRERGRENIYYLLRQRSLKYNIPN